MLDQRTGAEHHVLGLAWPLGSDSEGSSVVDFRYTSGQTARGSRPDAVSGTKVYLLKIASYLRLTYQIRLLTFLASEHGNKLVIRLPAQARMSPDLRAFVKKNARFVRIERTD